MFHVSLLRAYHASNDAMFPNRAHPEPYDFGAPDELLGHWWKGNHLEFEVRWSLGDTTWEMFKTCQELEALDRYLEIQGVHYPVELQRRGW